MKWGIWGEEICRDTATFWISEFIDSDVDRLKVQLCTQLRTPTMRRWRRSFWRLFLHTKCHRYDVVEILMYVDTNGPWYTWEMWWGIALKVFWGAKTQKFNENLTRKPVVQILKLCYWVIPFHSTWQCLGFKRDSAMFGDFTSWRCQGFYCNCPDVWAVATNPTHVLW